MNRSSRLRCLLLVFALFGSTGCYTIRNLRDYGRYERYVPLSRLETYAGRQELWIYGGTVSNYMDYPYPYPVKRHPFLVFFWGLPQLPFNIALDTLVLPVAIYRQSNPRAPVGPEPSDPVPAGQDATTSGPDSDRDDHPR